MAPFSADSGPFRDDCGIWGWRGSKLARMLCVNGEIAHEVHEEHTSLHLYIRRGFESVAFSRKIRFSCALSSISDAPPSAHNAIKTERGPTRRVTRGPVSLAVPGTVVRDTVSESDSDRPTGWARGPAACPGIRAHSGIRRACAAKDRARESVQYIQ